MIIIGHRGDQEKAPENSVKAVEFSIKKGLPFEIDIQLSKDGVFFLEHDDTLYRNFGIKKQVGTILSSQLDKLGVPRLEQILHIIPQDWFVLLELKCPPSPSAFENIIYIQEKYKLTKAVWISDQWKWNQFFTNFDIRHGWILHCKYSMHHNRMLNDTKSKIIITDKKMMSYISEKIYYKTLIYPVNTKEEFKEYKKMGLAGVISDKLSVLR